MQQVFSGLLTWPNKRREGRMLGDSPPPSTFMWFTWRLVMVSPPWNLRVQGVQILQNYRKNPSITATRRFYLSGFARKKERDIEIENWIVLPRAKQVSLSFTNAQRWILNLSRDSFSNFCLCVLFRVHTHTSHATNETVWKAIKNRSR